MAAKLSPRNRLLLAVSALLLGVSFVAPLWNIELQAPQYPEGLGMQIWTTQITGDVDNINILNHYIGMKPIHSEDFKEFATFPKWFAALMALGLLVAALGFRWPATAWVTLLLGFALWAFYDFYSWEHTFGTELNPDAPIKVEGMSYAPPLIGKKELLNISAWSLPGPAGYAFGLSVFLAVLSVLFDFKERRNLRRSTVAAALTAMSLFLGCIGGTDPEPILFGKDSCHHCKMTIIDKRFGGEIVTKKGKVFKFDALECLVQFKRNTDHQAGNVFVLDSHGTGELLSAKESVFIVRDDLRSPMGLGILATKTQEQMRDLLKLQQVEALDWTKIESLLEKE